MSTSSVRRGCGCTTRAQANWGGWRFPKPNASLVGGGKGTYDSLAKSIRDHAKRHGFGDDIPKYLRKAAAFNKKGAKKTVLDDGAVRWNRKNGEFLIERDGNIMSYGINSAQ